MSYVRALRAMAHMQRRFGFDLKTEIPTIHALTQSRGWRECAQHLRTLSSMDRFRALCELTSKLSAIWIATLIESGLTAQDIARALDHWLQYNTDKFDITCIVAAEPDHEFKKHLNLKLAKKYPNSRVHYRIDPSIRGGLKLVFPNFMIDNSLARKFKHVLQFA